MGKAKRQTFFRGGGAWAVTGLPHSQGVPRSLTLFNGRLCEFRHGGHFLLQGLKKNTLEVTTPSDEHSVRLGDLRNDPSQGSP